MFYLPCIDTIHRGDMGVGDMGVGVMGQGHLAQATFTALPLGASP